jgi:hypothetical protein
MVELGLSDEEFLSLPPNRFARLALAWERRERRTDQRFALIACILANIHRGSDQDPFEIEDFMPRQKTKANESRNRNAQLALNAALKTMAQVLKGPNGG